MPQLGAILYAAVLWAVRRGVLDLLVGLGVGVATFAGVGAALDKLKELLVQNLSGLPSQVLSVLSYMRVGVALSIILSAITMRLAIDGLKDGTIKRWRLK